MATWSDDWPKAAEVLAKILDNCHSIVFDFNKKVMEEYAPYIAKEKLLQEWYKEMVKRGKIQWRPDNDVSLTVYITDDDMKFVRLAVSLPSPRIIISGDSDFTKLKHHTDFVSRGIRIMCMEECNEL